MIFDNGINLKLKRIEAEQTVLRIQVVRSKEATIQAQGEIGWLTELVQPAAAGVEEPPAVAVEELPAVGVEKLSAVAVEELSLPLPSF